MESLIETSRGRLAVVTHEAPQSQGWCLSLHGGGPSTKETTDYLVPTFARAGYSFASLDFSGQGRSPGALGDSSLERRLAETLAVCGHLSLAPRVLVGTSMGGVHRHEVHRGGRRR